MSLFGHFSDQVWVLRRICCDAAGPGVVKKSIEKKVQKKVTKKVKKSHAEKSEGFEPELADATWDMRVP